MKDPQGSKRRRTQRDYNLAFKLAVVRQIEEGQMTYKQAQRKYGIQGKSTVLVWLRKHGNLDWSRPNLLIMSKSKETPAQKIKRLEKQLEDERLKNLILNKMVDTLDREYNTGLRKKFLPEQSGNSDNKKE